MSRSLHSTRTFKWVTALILRDSAHEHQSAELYAKHSFRDFLLLIALFFQLEVEEKNYARLKCKIKNHSPMTNMIIAHSIKLPFHIFCVVLN